MSPQNAAFSAMSFLMIVVSIVLLPSRHNYFRFLLTSFAVWNASALLIYFINSLVWEGNSSNRSPAWCDLSTHLLVAYNAAVSALGLAIYRKLFLSLKFRESSDNRGARLPYVDASICLGIPFVVMLLQIIVQDKRFDIFEDVGCLPSVMNTSITYAFFFTPSLVMFLISIIYIVPCIRLFFFKQRVDEWRDAGIELEKISPSSNEIDPNDFYRLFTLAFTCIVMSFSYTIAFLVNTIQGKAFINASSWAKSLNFNRVDTHPANTWREDPIAPFIELSRWSAVALGIVFLGLYALSDVSVARHRSACKAMRKLDLSSLSFKSGTKNIFAISAHFAPGPRPFKEKELNSSSSSQETLKNDIVPETKIYDRFSRSSKTAESVMSSKPPFPASYYLAQLAPQHSFSSVADHTSVPSGASSDTCVENEEIQEQERNRFTPPVLRVTAPLRVHAKHRTSQGATHRPVPTSVPLTPKSSMFSISSSPSIYSEASAPREGILSNSGLSEFRPSPLSSDVDLNSFLDISSPRSTVNHLK